MAKGTNSKGAVEMMEGAVQLLREAPIPALAAYYLGSVPFCLGFLYFWADMSRSSAAYHTLPEEAFLLSLLYIWMKTWQSRSAGILMAHLMDAPVERWGAGRFFRCAFIQAAFQPWGFLAVPAAAVFLLPFAWVVAFFQNVTVLGDGTGSGFGELKRKAWKLTGYEARQNNVVLLCTFFLGLFLFVDLGIAFTLGPHLLKGFLGVETRYSMTSMTFLNTTFFAIVCALTFLCIDPIVKAYYVLRCFYGESVDNGEDLKAGLGAAAKLSRALALMVFLSASVLPLTARAQSSGGVDPKALGTAIEKVLQEREYQWHMPRVKPDDAAKMHMPSVISDFLEASVKSIRDGFKKVVGWINDLVNWILKHIHPKPDEDGAKVKGDHGWGFEWIYGFLWVLLGLAAVALSLLIYRTWLKRARAVVTAEAVAPKVDVADERVSGNELPMDGWLGLARELLGQGDFRLALRAFYLASLSCLAQEKLLTLARSKSTLDYERELGRRAHGLPDLLSVFAEVGRQFDHGWYGADTVTEEAVKRFILSHERVVSIASHPTVQGGGL